MTSQNLSIYDQPTASTTLVPVKSPLQDQVGEARYVLLDSYEVARKRVREGTRAWIGFETEAEGAGHADRGRVAWLWADLLALARSSCQVDPVARRELDPGWLVVRFGHASYRPHKLTTPPSRSTALPSRL